MTLEYTYFAGTPSREIAEGNGSRDLKPTQVAVRITHCGVCGTDEHYAHTDYRLGHEGVGVITQLGSMVEYISEFKVGDRVGMSYYQKHCGHCKPCLTGKHHMCYNREYWGGPGGDQGLWASAVAWNVSALYSIPSDVPSEYAAPLMCAGATVWEPLTNSGARPGDRVGIIGVGGLGHLAIQFAAKMGLEPVVFSSTEEKREQAMAFGAREFHVTKDVEKLAEVDKIDLLLMTASSGVDLRTYLPVLARPAKIYPLTVGYESISLSPYDFIGGSITVVGSGLASPSSIRDMLSFAAKNGIKPQIEKFPMTKDGVTEAMAKLREGKMRYRGVLVVEQ